MHVFQRNYYRRSIVANWLGYTILPSLLPVVVTVVTALNRERLPSHFDGYIQMTDLIFMGLSLAVSNISMLQFRVIEDIKDRVLVSSMVCLTFLSFFLGLHSETGLTIVTTLIMLLFVIVTIGTSLEIALRSQQLKFRNINPGKP